MMKSFILVLGPQGSGKTTQGRYLSKYLKYQFLSTGELLRKLAQEKNPTGKKLAKYWVKGSLVPDKFINELVFPILTKMDVDGFVLDGYPRNLSQLNAFLTKLKMHKWELQKVFYIKLSDAKCVKRLILRAKKESRPDESAGTIGKRLSIYHSETKPLLDKYEEMGILAKINGDNTREDIFEDIKRLLS